MAKLNISSVISKSAVNSFTPKVTAEEFQLFIIGFTALKYIACLISIASGYSFFYYRLDSLISGFSNADFVACALAVMLLVVLEVITNSSISKGFKMLLTHRLVAGASCVVVAAIFYSASFRISCEGIYLAVSDNSKIEANIGAKFDEQAEDIKRGTAFRVKAYESDIQQIQPYAWANYQLTTEQLRMRSALRASIDSCYKAEAAQLRAIEEQRAEEIRQSNAVATSSAEDYRFYVAIILALELIANAVLVYFNKRILHETDEAVEKRHFIDKYVDDTRQELGDIIESELQQEKNLIVSVIRTKANEDRKRVKKAVSNVEEAKEDSKKAGFKISEDEPDAKAEEPSNAKIGGTAECRLCGQSFVKKTVWHAFCCENHKLQYNANTHNHTIRGVAPDYVSWPDCLPES